MDNMKSLEPIQKARTFVRDIDFEQSILKYIGPHLHITRQDLTLG